MDGPLDRRKGGKEEGTAREKERQMSCQELVTADGGVFVAGTEVFGWGQGLWCELVIFNSRLSGQTALL